MKRTLFLYGLILLACHRKINLPAPERSTERTGTEFYRQIASFKWQQRDSMAVREILSGNIPRFLRKLVPVKTEIRDSSTGKIIRARFYVMPDYLSIGTGADWARIHITPMAAQKIADSLQCFLPTRKMVDDIYRAASVKLEPVPLFAYRDSSPTMYHHHLIIEGQRKSRKGLIAGIKKDLVISDRISRQDKPDRVAIYGWHKPDGTPIQPLYTGHVSWWVDYSQGTRLVYRKIRVNNTWMDYTDVLKHPVLRRLLCDEQYCDFYKYSY